jgi:hypothetical protein
VILTLDREMFNLHSSLWPGISVLEEEH